VHHHSIAEPPPSAHDGPTEPRNNVVERPKSRLKAPLSLVARDRRRERSSEAVEPPVEAVEKKQKRDE